MFKDLYLKAYRGRMELERLDFCTLDHDKVPTGILHTKTDKLYMLLVKMKMATIEAKDATEYIKEVSWHHPLPDFLRHLKRVRPVLDSGGKKTGLLQVLVSTIEDDLEEEADDLGEVPSVQPFTREQYERFNRIWPVTFHQSMLQKQAASENQQALEVARRFSPLEHECIIIDPRTMEAVGDSSAEPTGPLDHPVMRAISQISYRSLHSEIPETQYLCTGYFVVIKSEPCFMCAMALVHSRVEAVIFWDANDRRGAFTSTTTCEWLKSCNHRYRIYRLK